MRGRGSTPSATAPWRPSSPKLKSSAKAAASGRKNSGAHDCGQIINPGAILAVIEGNIVQALSRTLIAEVKFDQNKVLRVDWAAADERGFSAGVMSLMGL